MKRYKNKRHLYDKAAQPKQWWTANAELLHMRNAPEWMVRASYKRAARYG